MSVKEDQGVLNKYIEGLEPAFCHTSVGVEPMCFDLCDLGGFQWKVSFQWKIENGKWKMEN